jgi:hypothetical protein
MKRNVIIFCACAILLLLSGLAYAGDFVYQTIDNLSGTGEMVIAPVRNDGINRLYATGSGLFEYTWQDNAWQKVTIQLGPGAPVAITAGFGRNDSIWRLYGATGGKKLYEYSYEGGVWNAALVESTINVKGSVKLGDIKNDDTIRIVAGGNDYVTMIYTYQTAGNTWRAETLDVNTNDIQGITIGKGRNDDTNRVYTGGGNTPFYEYSFSNNVWSKYFITNGVFNSVVGDGRNDDTNRLYGVGLAEDTWRVDHWQFNFLDTNAESYSGPSVILDGRNDGKNRLYVAARGLGGPADSVSYYVYLMEKSYDSITGWFRKEIPAITYDPYIAMWWVAAGNARNDNVNRIYVITYAGHLFEFNWDDTINGVEQEGVKDVNEINIRKALKVAPNPFYNYANIANMPTNAEIRIYDITGRMVEKTANKIIGQNLNSGVYFIMAKGYKPAKIIKLKKGSKQ